MEKFEEMLRRMLLDPMTDGTLVAAAFAWAATTCLRNGVSKARFVQMAADAYDKAEAA